MAGCGCGGARARAQGQPSIAGYMYQPPRLPDNSLPPEMGPFQTILEARAEQRRHGGGKITTVKK